MNPNKTISANSKGINISFGDVNKHKFVYYDNSREAIKKIQLEGRSKYQEFEKPEFNKCQQTIYSQIVYGLKSISNEVLMEMPSGKIREIELLHKRAKLAINRYKQEVANQEVNTFLIKLFPKSPIVKQMTAVNGSDDYLTTTLTLRDLKITKTMLAKKLISLNILPENFFNLV